MLGCENMYLNSYKCNVLFGVIEEKNIHDEIGQCERGRRKGWGGDLCNALDFFGIWQGFVSVNTRNDEYTKMNVVVLPRDEW